MNSLQDLLKRKADAIETDGIKTDIDLVQSELDRFFDKQIKVRSIKEGVASVSAFNSPVASEMRMQQTQLLEDLNSSLQNKLNRFIIRIV